MFIFFSTKILTEPLFMIFIATSILMFACWKKSGRVFNILVAGVLAGLAFLTRYLGWILIFSFVLYFMLDIIRKRGAGIKHLLVLLFGFFLVLSPWMLFNMLAYGNPFGAFLENLVVYSGSSTQSLLQGLYDIFVVAGISGLLSFLGLFVIVKRNVLREHLLLVIVFVISLAVYLVLPHKEPRYLLSFLPLYAMLSGFAISSIPRSNIKNVVKVVVVVISLMSVFSGVINAWNNWDAEMPMLSAISEVKLLTGLDEAILSPSYPYVYYFGDRRCITFCGIPSTADKTECADSADEIISLADEYNISYIITNAFEPSNILLEGTDDRIEKLKSYEMWENPEAISIYRIIR